MRDVSSRTERQLGRVANAAGITRAELRDLIESVVDEYLDLVPRGHRRQRAPRGDQTARKTGARLVFGVDHTALSYVADPEGTDIVPSDYEPPPGYPGP
jgi:hypothetical protein